MFLRKSLPVFSVTQDWVRGLVMCAHSLATNPVLHVLESLREVIVLRA